MGLKSIPTNKGRKVSPLIFRPFFNYTYFCIGITSIATALVKKYGSRLSVALHHPSPRLVLAQLHITP
jgi:hypothetical protein